MGAPLCDQRALPTGCKACLEWGHPSATKGRCLQGAKHVSNGGTSLRPKGAAYRVQSMSRMGAPLCDQRALPTELIAGIIVTMVASGTVCVCVRGRRLPLLSKVRQRAIDQRVEGGLLDPLKHSIINEMWFKTSLCWTREVFRFGSPP